MSSVKSIASIHRGKLQTGTFLAGCNTITAIGAFEEMKVAASGGVSLLLKLYLILLYLILWKCARRYLSIAVDKNWTEIKT